MIIDILQHTPIWVWILFAAVIGLGVMQTRDRQITVARATIVPLIFIALSLSGVYRAGAGSALPIAAWVAGFAAVWLFARDSVAIRGAARSADSGLLLIPGSWLPLTLIVGLFALKYGAAVIQGMRPTLAAEASFSAALNLAYGVFAGLFWSRSWSLRRLVRRNGVARPHANPSN